MLIKIPNLSLVVLIGPSGSGKTTFLRKHFRPSEIISSDACRAMVGDNENDQTATPHAFEILHHIAAKRRRQVGLRCRFPLGRRPVARFGSRPRAPARKTRPRRFATTCSTPTMCSASEF